MNRAAYMSILIFCLAFSATASIAEARGWGRGHWKPSVPGTEAEKPVEWMRDLDQAAEVAAKEDRGLMILFTSRDVMQSSPLCRFAGDRIRRSTRASGLIPVMVLPPEAPGAAELRSDKDGELRKAYELATKRYRETVQRYGITQAPSLVLAAPDMASLCSLVAPSDSRIRTALDNIGGLIARHKASSKASAGEKVQAGSKASGPADSTGKKQPEADPDPAPAPEPAKKKPEVTDPGDDF